MGKPPSNPADWQLFEAAADAPVTKHDAADASKPDPVRTREVSAQLARMLFACVLAQRTNEKKPDLPKIATRFGLLGGLGQGKTSALHMAVDHTNLLLKQAGSDQQPLNVAYFDAAKELPQDLEFEFDRLQSSLSIWRLAGRALRQLGAWCLLVFSWAVLIYVVLPRFSPLPLIFDWTKQISGTVLLSLPFLSFVFNTQKFWARRWERFFNFERPATNAHLCLLDKWAAELSELKAKLHSMRIPVDLLIVDNLDRASITQQRAVLRAVYKHQDDFHHALIVAFDESGLLRNTDHDPEAPEQLLAKAIQAVVRVPDRQPVEAILLTRLAIHALPQEEWRQAICQADIERAFAEVLLLVGPLSPRVAKRLLNDSCALLAQLPDALRRDPGSQGDAALHDVPLAQRAKDWMSALFRLQGLWQIYPALHSQPQCLCRVLECPDEANLTLLRQAVAESKTDTRWERFLRDTTHLRPVNGEWASLVAMAGTQYWSKPEQTSLIESLPPSDYKLLDMIWKAVEAVTPMQDEQGLRVFGEFLPVNKDELNTNEKELLPLLLCVLQLWSAVQLVRLRAVAVLELFLRVCATEKDSWLAKADPAGKFRSGLTSLLIARASTVGTLNAANLKRWLDWSGNASAQWRMESILLCPAKNLTWFELWLLLDTSEVVGAGDGSANQAADLNVCNPVELSCWIKTLAPMNPADVRERIAQLRDVLPKLDHGARHTLLLHWPALPAGTDVVGDDAVWAALSMYRCVHLAAPTAIWPQALGILWSNCNFDPRALTAIFAFPGEPKLENWDISLALKLRGASPENLVWKKWIEQAGERGEVRAAIFLLLALDGAEALKRNMQFFDNARTCWPSESKWLSLVHDAVQSGCMSTQGADEGEAWRNFAQGEPELFAWLKGTALGNVPVAQKATYGSKQGLLLLRGLITPDEIAVRSFADPGQDMQFEG